MCFLQIVNSSCYWKARNEEVCVRRVMSSDLSVLFMHLSTCHFGALEHSKHILTAHKSTCVEGCALFFI